MDAGGEYQFVLSPYRQNQFDFIAYLAGMRLISVGFVSLAMLVFHPLICYHSPDMAGIRDIHSGPKGSLPSGP